MLDWLIVGGGIHGTHIANVLLSSRLGVGKRDQTVKILDPNPVLLSRWLQLTTGFGMYFLRSPRVHHIDIPSNSLHQFITSSYSQGSACYLQPYYRPQLKLFNDHCQTLIDKNSIATLHCQASAERVKKHQNGFEVSTSHGSLNTKNIILCLGANSNSNWPSWATKLKTQTSRIGHVFHNMPSWRTIEDARHVTIIGGGLTAAQLTIECLKQTSCEIAMVSRHSLRVHQFDSDPGWIGPKFQEGFRKIESRQKRRAIVNDARHRGSVTEETAFDLRNLALSDRFSMIIDEIDSVVYSKLQQKCNRFVVTFRNRKSISTDVIVLATGFEQKRPGGEFLDGLIDEFNLSCAPCGYPILNSTLQWFPHIYVTGQLAELEIGPVSRNIVGARLAGRRLYEMIN